MDESVTVILAVGMVLRLTRLAATDAITEPLRRPLSGWALKLITCGWCVSIWISILFVAPSWWAWADHRWWQACGVVAIASWLAGVTHTWGAGRPTPVEFVSPMTVFVDNVSDIDIDTEPIDDDTGDA